ncbi:hypothetical protein LVD15_23850 [Fulvivirga maritima]|uniref:hypothetical protein n=1 Tax=Fulvivirga maritima TaxID=2904247 RepID=UPI001F1CA2F8|nr:hypothetical protein [Fulvivirga maritima]UII26294.1 hypothetical protein LVD15_23850 [Fulvivirga maritima]
MGGPIVAGYLLAENFKKLGKSHLVSQTWTYTIFFTLALLLILIFIPEDINIPNIIFPVIEVAIVRYLFTSLQKQDAEAYIESGGEYYGWGRVILISLIGLVITVAAILVLSIFFL